MIKFIKIILLCAIAPMLFGAAPTEKSVEVIGKGESEDAALLDAFRSALVKAGFLEISTKQSLVDGEMEYDKVSVTAKAYVESYKVLKKGKDPKTDENKIKISALVKKSLPNTKVVVKPVELVRCKKCKGEGKNWIKTTCGRCRGEGLLPDEFRRGIGGRVMHKRGGTCPKCKGKGYEEHTETCKECRGKKYVQADEVIETEDKGEEDSDSKED